MALHTTSQDQNICSVRPLLDVSEANIVAINDNSKPSALSAFIKNETSFLKRLVACIFDTIFIAVLYILTYQFFKGYHNQLIVDALYLLYPYFYYVCIPSLSKGTIGMLVTHLRCVRSDGEGIEFSSYHQRFIAVHFFMLLYLSMSLMMHSPLVSIASLSVLENLQSYSLIAYGLWLGMCFLSVLLSPLKRGIYEKLSRTMVISYHMHQ